MSRIQTRISDYRRPEIDQTNRPAGRPVVVRSRIEPQVTIRLTGHSTGGLTSRLTGPSTGEANNYAPAVKRNRHPAIHGSDRLVLAPNQVLQCEYHLMDFDGIETGQPKPLAPLLPTFRRKRRGAVVKPSNILANRLANRLGNGSESAWVRRRETSASSPPVRASITAIENSVIWQTAGKGDTDFGVHFFERRDAKKHQLLELYRPYVFRTICPSSPLTYHGKLLSISWLVRVRVFLSSGDGLTFERKFDLVAQ